MAPNYFSCCHTLSTFSQSGALCGSLNASLYQVNQVSAPVDHIFSLAIAGCVRVRLVAFLLTGGGPFLKWVALIAHGVFCVKDTSPQVLLVDCLVLDFWMCWGIHLKLCQVFKRRPFELNCHCNLES